MYDTVTAYVLLHDELNNGGGLHLRLKTGLLEYDCIVKSYRLLIRYPYIWDRDLCVYKAAIGAIPPRLDRSVVMPST